MINIKLTKRKDGMPYEKNVLYKITGKERVCFTEYHDGEKENLWLCYNLEKDEYGIYAHEYKRPGLLKNNCKTADVLSCVINEDTKEVFTLILEVKKDISSFSDDLTKENAVLVAVKEVRDFIEQIDNEILHKKSFMLYYAHEGYEETELIGIVTRNFEEEKFEDAASMLEKMFNEEKNGVTPLLQSKLKSNLKPYLPEAEKLRQFSRKKVNIGEKIYDLKVYLLNRKSDLEYFLAIDASHGTVIT